MTRSKIKIDCVKKPREYGAFAGNGKRLFFFPK